MKVMPTVELDPDWTTSPFSTLSPIVQDDRDAVWRIALALPMSLVRWPITLPALAPPHSLCELLVASKRVDESAGKMGTIGRRQRGALLALEVVLQHQFAVVPGQDQVDAGSLEISVEQQFRVGNDDGADRRPMR